MCHSERVFSRHPTADPTPARNPYCPLSPEPLGSANRLLGESELSVKLVVSLLLPCLDPLPPRPCHSERVFSRHPTAGPTPARNPYCPLSPEPLCSANQLMGDLLLACLDPLQVGEGQLRQPRQRVAAVAGSGGENIQIAIEDFHPP